MSETPFLARPGAGAPPGGRDRFRWDDRHHQPHTDLSYLQKLWASRADAADFLSLVGHSARMLLPVVRAYRSLCAPAAPTTAPATLCGVAISPRRESWERYQRRIVELGVRSVLVRVPVWEAEAVLALKEELAATAASGVAVTFVLVQDRAAVRDPPRWRAFVDAVCGELGAFAWAFQIGQAPNRKKWGVWHPGEYVRLLEGVQDARATWPRCRWLGPSVIDFEYHFTLDCLCRSRPFDFDGIAALLYVDRRGAPESCQYGHFDLQRKIQLLRAVIEASPHPAVPIHLTEFNWPLRGSGAFSPAGRHVQVDEPRQAAYLVRYFLAAAATGWVESAFWWQLVAKGYGLLDGDGEWRPRPAFAALAALQRRLPGRAVQRLPGGRRPIHGYLLTGGGCEALLYAADSPVRLGGRVPMTGAATLSGHALDPATLVLGDEPCWVQVDATGPVEALELLGTVR